MSRKDFAWHPIILATVVFFLTECAITLAPQYDKALVDGLTKTNAEVMEFLALVSDGTQKETFDQRKEKYASLVGSFDALEIQAKARPIPKNKITDEINALLSKRGAPIPVDSETPSATAIAKISETVAKMRDTDRKQGVTATEVLAFKNQVSICLDQALTYESFLKR